VRILLLLTAALTVAACQFPRDPDGTLDRVRGGTMVVGWTVHEPWVIGTDGDAPGGLEPDLMEALAREIGAEVEWAELPEAELGEALRRKVVDVGIGGLTVDSLLRREVSLTRSYVTAHLEVATPTGGDLPDDLEGTRVAVQAHSPGEGRLRQATKAIVVPVESLTALPDDVDAVAAWDFELDDLGLRPTEKELVEERHVIGLPMGENAWQVEVEGFLLDRGEEIARALRAEVPR
jgi:polar amino acid transport system substrate-binding protein